MSHNEIGHKQKQLLAQISADTPLNRRNDRWVRCALDSKTRKMLDSLVKRGLVQLMEHTPENNPNTTEPTLWARSTP